MILNYLNIYVICQSTTRTQELSNDKIIYILFKFYNGQFNEDPFRF